jgi:8-amino-7-oxononanoate synthase
LNLDQLEEQLARTQPSGRTVFVVTESVFSMDGDYPDLARMAELKRRYGFCWIVDEAHALGWYGPEGAGLVRAAGVEPTVDILVGTLGKTLAAGGAYTLFREEAVRDYFVNTAGEFIYSTGFPPANAAAAQAALGCLRALAGQQSEWQERSRAFRSALQAAGWSAPAGESPVVPVRLDDEDAALSLAGALREAGIYAAAVRPPTVPAGTSRLRFSLKRTFTRADMERVLAAMAAWRARR